MTEPSIRVVRGEPTDEELAALTVVLLALRDSCATPVPARELATWRGEHGRYRSPVSWRHDAA